MGATAIQVAVAVDVVLVAAAVVGDAEDDSRFKSIHSGLVAGTKTGRVCEVVNFATDGTTIEA